jgi:hypothetical protein
LQQAQHRLGEIAGGSIYNRKSITGYSIHRDMAVTAVQMAQPTHYMAEASQFSQDRGLASVLSTKGQLVSLLPKGYATQGNKPIKKLTRLTDATRRPINTVPAKGPLIDA